MEINIDSQENYPLTEFDGQPYNEKQKRKMQRSNTDAKEARPKLRVAFNTLPYSQQTDRQLSTEDIDLIGSKAHQIGKANWSGGWQNTILTRRRKGLNPSCEEEEVTEIAQAMSDDHRLMADDVNGEVMRRDALRELTKSLRVRRKVKHQLTHKRSSLRSSQQNVTYINAFKYSLSMKWFKLKLRIYDALHDYSLWHKDLKDIEGIYGSSIGSYFSFLRYLFILNLLVSIIIIGFLLVPQQLFDKYNTNELNNDNGTDYFLSLEKKMQNSSYPSENKISFGALDLLTGAGWFNSTELYYGSYSYDRNIRLFGSILHYDICQAYFFTMLVCFFFYLFVLLQRIFKLYKLNYIDTDEDVNASFVQKIVSAWDFNITDESAAKVKHRSIYNELIEMLQEYNSEEDVLGFWGRMKERCWSLIMWGVCIAFLMVLGFCLFILLRDGLKDFTEKEFDYWRSSLELLVYPLIVTLIMVIFPVLFEAFARFEKFKSPRHELYSTLVRVTLLQLTILVVLVVFWYFNSPVRKDDKFFDLESMSTTPLPLNQTTRTECWENAFGEEIYRLVFIDFLVIIISVLLIDTSKKRIVKSGRADKSYQEFALARNILHIIYNQTLLWVGVFFCPLLPLIISIKFLIIFYLQKFNVTRNLEPQDRPVRAAQTETLFYTLTLFSFILCCFYFVFILISGYSSKTCGPFQGYDHYGQIILSVSDDTQILVKIFSIIFKPNGLFFIIIVMSCVLYGLKNVAEGRIELVDVLRQQLSIEMKDRAFLQKLIERAKTGEQVLGSPRSGPSSPLFEDEDSKFVTRRTSFVFSRSQDTQSQSDDSTGF